MAESQIKGGGTGTAPPAAAEPASDSLRALATVDSGPEARGSKSIETIGIGSVVGRYVVLERLGAGAMGVVFAAFDPDLDRKIALKLLPPHHRDGDRVRREERLVREAKAIAKLSHPNIVGIYDVGVHQDQVFLAMEHLSGGTLRRWLATEKREWRDVLRVFLDAARGLAAAHKEKLIHRDFKPENVLLDRNGVAKVVDFGLVRLTEAGRSAAYAVLDGSDPDGLPSPALDLSPATLTRTGALMGTPAYMAPEQFLARPADARSDQFAFCASLYEALYGERPFAGETVVELAKSVTRGALKPVPAATTVPGWIRKVLVRGLSGDPNARFASLTELIETLERDPVALRRRIALTSAVVAAVAIAGTLITKRVERGRAEAERQAAEHVAAADAFLADAAAKRGESTTLRTRAFAAFDGFERDNGESLWAQALAAANAAEAGYQRGVQRLEAAVALTPRRDLKDRIADALVEYIEMDGRSTAEREASLRHLAPFDEGGARSRLLTAPATVGIETIPSGLTAEIETYDPVTHLVTDPARPIGRTPLQLNLPQGSYRLVFKETTTHAGFQYPILLSAGERYDASLRVPLRSSIPKDFVYVPEGRFLFGSANEELRTAFLSAVPIHAVRTPAFLMSRYETTIREWITFIETLSPGERERRRPQGRKDVRGGLIEVRETPREGWELQFRATDQKMYRATQAERLQYGERTRRVSQDWLRFPVTGISPTDATAFVAWLDRSGRVPGARLCTEHEWERAARGADGREFPHGDKLASDDANFDLTYGRKNSAFGPDEVGSHSASVSPFLVHDLAGNAWDMAVSVLDRGQFVVRGGSFYQGTPSLRASNRDPIGALTRDHTVGLRVCANPRF
jgi:formylglycine-generating enzyme required for sulfatase activity